MQVLSARSLPISRGGLIRKLDVTGGGRALVRRAHPSKLRPWTRWPRRFVVDRCCRGCVLPLPVSLVVLCWSRPATATAQRSSPRSTPFAFTNALTDAEGDAEPHALPAGARSLPLLRPRSPISTRAARQEGGQSQSRARPAPTHFGGARGDAPWAMVNVATRGSAATWRHRGCRGGSLAGDRQRLEQVRPGGALELVTRPRADLPRKLSGRPQITQRRRTPVGSGLVDAVHRGMRLCGWLAAAPGPPRRGPRS